MPHEQPVSVRKSLIVIVLFLLVASITFAGLIASAMKKKRDYEQSSSPITNQKVMPKTINNGVNTPDRRKQIEQKKDAANEAVLRKHGFSVTDGGHSVSVKQ